MDVWIIPKFIRKNCSSVENLRSICLFSYWASRSSVISPEWSRPCLLLKKKCLNELTWSSFDLIIRDYFLNWYAFVNSFVSKIGCVMYGLQFISFLFDCDHFFNISNTNLMNDGKLICFRRVFDFLMWAFQGWWCWAIRGRYWCLGGMHLESLRTSLDVPGPIACRNTLEILLL